jgi:hypothetical protein
MVQKMPKLGNKGHRGTKLLYDGKFFEKRDGLKLLA